nr:MAG TPA: hypothetical protein [Caudoviricetes sp.]
MPPRLHPADVQGWGNHGLQSGQGVGHYRDRT